MSFFDNTYITCFADHLSEIILFLDRTGSIVYVNSSVLHILGFLPDELIGRDLVSLLHPSERAWLTSVCNGAKPASHWRSVYTKLQTRDGNFFPCNLDYCIQTPPDQSYDIIIIAHGTTNNIVQEDDPDCSVDMLQTVLDSILDGVAIVSNTGDILYANKAARLIVGIPQSYDIKNFNIEVFLDAGSRKKASENLMQIIHGGSVHITEYRLQDKNATGEWIEAIGSRILFEGKPAGLVSFRDITDKKRVKEEIKQIEKQYATIVNEAPEPIIIHTQEIVTFINEAGLQISGYDRDEIIGHPVYAYLTESSNMKVIEAMKAREDGNQIREYEVDFITKSGAILHLLVKNSVIVCDKESHVLLFISDITQRKQLEEALRQANKRLNLLNRITRHDLSNKIASLEAYCLMTHNDVLSPEARYRLELLEQTISMIKEMIEFFRTYQHLGVHDPQWVDISVIMKECISMMKNLPCTPSCDIGHILVYADPLIKRVFFNLLENSARHGGNVSTITCSWYVLEKNGIFRYCDDGIGVSHDEKEKIFEEGYGKNSGMGLFLVREILAITGMTIRENGVPGSGVQFEIIVPSGIFRYT